MPDGPRADVSKLGLRAPFREQGREISWLEGFSDCAFGFAITLLVVSLDVAAGAIRDTAYSPAAAAFSDPRAIDFCW